MLTNIKSYKHIMWDWNGTLLDDVNIAINAMNNLLRRRTLALLDIETYKDIFTFPVRDYYARLGFDFNMEPFEKLAIEFVSEFNSENIKFKLYNGAEDVLKFIMDMGIGQSILSASQEQELNNIISKLKIKEYFIKVAGLNNHYALSKVARGKELLTDLCLKPEEVLLVGDTIHDYEVSKEIGCDCLLICNGHQSYQRISVCPASIVKTISDVIEYIKEKEIA